MSQESFESMDHQHKSWEDISPYIQELDSVTGGYSTAKRGLATLPTGERLFVKIGTNEGTKRAAKREVSVYRSLSELGYEHVPNVLSVSDNEESFALEALTVEAGWNWSNEWSAERLSDSLRVIDELAACSEPAKSLPIFERVEDMMQVEDGWLSLVSDIAKQTKLRELLETAGREDVMISFAQEAVSSSQYTVKQDTLVHFDLRADNVAWHKERREVRIVDWNWACLGDRDIDMAAFLTHVARFNKEIVLLHKDRLAPAALHYMAGFWLNNATKPLWEGGPVDLRPMQLASGLMAYQLYRYNRA